MGTGDLARVVIAGGHPVIRGVVRLSCADVGGLEVVGESEDLDGAVVLCDTLRPDVLVLDADLGDDVVDEAIARLRSDAAGIPVLVLSDRTDGATVLTALRLGVRGFVGKRDGLRTVGEAIRRVADGERAVSAPLEQAAVAALGSLAKQAREGTQMRANLTPRELEILVLVSQGLTMQQAATRLGISPRTVETHVAKLYRKLEVRTRVQAVARAAQLGLIDLR
ncbi:MAG: response regulator transcription factor [Actinomycetota bacterium]